MAETQDQMINRLQQRKHQITRMLIPGSKAPARGKSIRSLSSVFNQAGAGRFRLAARKMRFLDESKLGTLQTGTLKNFSKGIPDKFREVQGLIHLTPKYEGGASIWSILERTLPNQGGAGFEAPSLPGTLGPGSVIQKFSMVPKPGQSLEAFAEQAESITPPKKLRAPTKPPRLSPKSRLYTSVQEITDQDVAASDRAETPDEKPAADTQTPEAGAVQRQVESLPPLEVAEPEIIVDDTSEDLPETPVTELEIPPSPQPRPKTAKPAKVKPREESEIRELPKAKPAAKKAEFAPGIPVLPKAKPRSTVTRTVQRASAATAHPKTGKPRSTPGVPAQPRGQLPGSKQIQESKLKVEAIPSPRPEPDTAILPTPPPTPRDDDVQPPPALRRESDAAPLPEMKGEAQPVPAQLEPQAAPPIEMPLPGKIEAQKQVTRAFKSLEPEAITPPKEPPLLTRLEQPLIPTQKYRPTVMPEGRPITATPTGQEISRDVPFMPEMDVYKSLESRLFPDIQLEAGGFSQVEARPSSLTEPLALPVAYPIPPGRTQQRPPIPPPLPDQPLPAEEQLLQRTPEGELLPKPTPEPELEMPDLTQIPWDEPSQIDTGDTIRRVIEEPEIVGDDEPEPEEIYLEQLAEDVLPLVKRILEIESERLASNLK
jgi:hypothetical protein